MIHLDPDVFQIHLLACCHLTFLMAQTTFEGVTLHIRIQRPACKKTTILKYLAIFTQLKQKTQTNYCRWLSALNCSKGPPCQVESMFCRMVIKNSWSYQRLSGGTEHRVHCVYHRESNPSAFSCSLKNVMLIKLKQLMTCDWSVGVVVVARVNVSVSLRAALACHSWLIFPVLLLCVWLT